ncbi:MAG: DEAD/DEAH box helicase [Myxococcales bacterium]|nr:DEAD/DEAH box helicase [Myxococcales bacterium]
MTTEPFASVPAPLRTAMEQRGFTSLTEVQLAVLAADTEAHDLRISSQTGSGKTVALGLALARGLLAEREADPDDAPPRSRRPAALVITPTRELAVQVRDELRWLLAELGTRVDVVTGGTDLGGERRMLRRPPTVLVGTPGRLLDHLRAGAVDCSGVAQVVLDEADRMLEMGFREELEAIVDALPAERRSHLVSATFPAPVLRVADRFQGADVLHLQGTTLGEANGDIDHVAQVVPATHGYAALVNALLLARGERVLVFVDRRAEASDLAERLASDGFAALPFSGDLSQAQRTRTLQSFRTGTIPVLVSTDVAARGIDVPEITMVVHMGAPRSADDYTHRSGRTGRAGQRGRSLLLVPPRARGYAGRLLADAGVEADWQTAPTPAKVRKANTKHARRRLHARLDDPSGPSDKSLQYAVSLLEGRDPATVVATLLELAEPPLTREPMEIPAVVEERPWTPADANRRPRPYRPRPHRGAAPRRARRDGSDRRA